MRPLSASEYQLRTGQKRGVREHNRQMRDTVVEQHQYIEDIIWAAVERISQRRSLGVPVDMLTVWNDFDPPTGINFQTNQMRLPRWRELSEYMKYQLAAVCTIGAEGYSFTAKLNPELESIWASRGYDYYELVKRRLAAEIRSAGIENLMLAYAVEGKTKKGVRTGIHLHGFFFADTGPPKPNKVRSAIEAALQVGLHRIGKRRGRDVKVQLIYDTGLRNNKNPGRWAAYNSKHAVKPDDRLPNRRIYMNRTMTQIAKVMWGVIKEVPEGEE